MLYYWRLELYGGDNHAFKGLIFHVHVLIKLSSRDIQRHCKDTHFFYKGRCVYQLILANHISSLEFIIIEMSVLRTIARL